jgi:hypothetical protein
MTKKKKIKKPSISKSEKLSLKDSAKIPPKQQKPFFSLSSMDKYKIFCIGQCEKKEKAAFSDTLYKLSQLTWGEILSSQRHGCGHEKIDRKQITRPLPDDLKEDENIIAFRFCGKKPMVGYKRENVFHIIWVDPKFKLYKH